MVDTHDTAYGLVEPPLTATRRRAGEGHLAAEAPRCRWLVNARLVRPCLVGLFSVRRVCL